MLSLGQKSDALQVRYVRDWSKSMGGGGWAGAEGGVGRAIFSYPYGVGHPVFIVGIDTHLTQSTTKVTLFEQ